MLIRGRVSFELNQFGWQVWIERCLKGEEHMLPYDRLLWLLKSKAKKSFPCIPLIKKKKTFSASIKSLSRFLGVAIQPLLLLSITEDNGRHVWLITLIYVLSIREECNSVAFQRQESHVWNVWNMFGESHLFGGRVFWKRWEYQTTWSASWEICMQVREQQLELDMEQQTGSK